MNKAFSTTVALILCTASLSAAPKPEAPAPKAAVSVPTADKAADTNVTIDDPKQREENLYLRAQEFLAKGDSQAAYEIGLTLFEAQSDEPRYNLLLGRAALETGRYDEAMGAYERVTLIDEHNSTAMLGMGKLYIVANNHPAALEALHMALLSNQSSAEQRKEALSIINQIDPPKPAPVAPEVPVDEKKRHKHFSAFAMIGIEYDSNANNSPYVDKLIPNPTDALSGTTEQDLSHLEAVGLSWVVDPMKPSGFLLRTDLGAYNQMYRENDHNDLQMVSLALTPIHESGMHQISLPLSYEHIWFGQEEMLGAIGYGLGYQIALDAQTQLFVSGNQKLKSYSDTYKKKGYDASTLSFVQIGAFKHFSEGKQIKATVDWGKEEKDGGTRDDIAATFIGARLDLSYRLWEVWQFGAHYAYRQSDFDDITRTDKNHNPGISFATIINKSYELGIRYDYVKNESDDNNADYTKQLLGVTWLMKF